MIFSKADISSPKGWQKNANNFVNRQYALRLFFLDYGSWNAIVLVSIHYVVEVV